MTIVFRADDCSSREHCAGRLRPIASVGFFDVRVHPCEIASAPVRSGRHGQGHGSVGLVVEGKIVISQDGRQAVMGAGDFSFVDGTRASRVVVPDDLHMIGVVVPLGMISVARRVLGELTATRMDGASGSGALFTSFLTTLGANLESVRPREEAGLSAAVGDLLTATLANAAGNDMDGGDVGARSALLTRIRCFVEARLSDPGLSPASIAAAHHISVRQLHRLFEGEDVTVAELVRAHRLAGCARDLADPKLRDLGIGVVAARWGIMDSAKFSRIFRAAYGLSPREYRAGFGAYRQERMR